MAHEIEVVPNNFKKGDRVQHIRSGKFATVAEDQYDSFFVHIVWDHKPDAEPMSYVADAFRTAPYKDAVRYRKTLTTVFTNGQSTVEFRGTVADADLEADKDDEHERLTNIARSGPVGRIETVFQGSDAVVVVYDTGLTKVFNWVAVTE